MDTQKFKENGHNKFPVTTETLHLLQEQSLLAAQLTRLLGVSHCILKDSTAAEDGLVVIDYELLPLRGTPDTYVTVMEETESVTFDDETIENARTRRWAQYTHTYYGEKSIHIYGIKYTSQGSQSIREVYGSVTTNAKHLPPRGTVCDWYGTMSTANIAYGWVPCGRLLFQTEAARNSQMNAWKNRYPEGIGFDTANATEGLPGLRIVSVTAGGITTEVPDLTDRFVVTAGNCYNVGKTGGENYHTLTIKEMPSHSHTYTKSDNIDNDVRHDGSDSIVRLQQTVVSTGSTGGGAAHENRPPYFALYKIIKVI